MKYDFETLLPSHDAPNPMWDILKEMGIDDPDVIMFGVAEMKFELAPPLRRVLQETAAHSAFGYSLGAPKTMTDAVCNWFARRHNWTIQPDQLLQTYGVVPAIGYGIKTFSEPGDGIMVLYPCYDPFVRMVELSQRRMVPCHLKLENDSWQLDLEDLERKAADPTTKVLLLCNPHNPTGRVWTRQELEAIGEICLRHDIKVVSDDIHCDLVYAPHKYTPFASLSKELADITITATAPSKTFNMAGLTVSNLIVQNPETKEKLSQIAERDMFKYINTFGFAACTAVYNECEDWLEEVLQMIRGNADYFRDWMAEHFPAVKVYPLEGTYLQWADFSCFGEDPAERGPFLAGKAHFFSDCGAKFGADYGRYQRINLAAPRRYLEAALNRLEQAWKNR